MEADDADASTALLLPWDRACSFLHDRCVFSVMRPVDIVPVFCTGAAKIVWWCLYFLVFVHFFRLAVFGAPEFMHFGNGRMRELSVWVWPALPAALAAAEALTREQLRSEAFRDLAEHGCADDADVEKIQKACVSKLKLAFLLWIATIIVAGAQCLAWKGESNVVALFWTVPGPCAVLSAPMLVIAMVFLALVSEVSVRSVEHFVAAVSPCTPGTEFNSEAFWIDRLCKHRALDRRLHHIWKCIAGPLTIGVVVGAVLALLCVIDGFVIFEHDMFLEAFMKFSVAFGYCVVVLMLLVPLAEIGETCGSRRKLSILIAATDSGAQRMSPEARLGYLALMAQIDRLPLGVDLPIMGIVNIRTIVFSLRLVTYGATATVSFFLTKMGDHHHER